MAFSPFKVLKSLLIRQENTTTPREVEIVPGGSASTKTTIQSSQTANRTLTLPDATDTLVGRSTTDTLTNKSIDADTNTITNIENSDIKAAAAIDATKIAAGTVDNTEFGYLDGVTSSIQTQLNDNATAISDHLADPTDAHDASAISSVPAGNLVATDVQSALDELQSDVDTRATSSALTAHTSASSGVHGVSGSVVGTSDTQTLTNKTLTLPTMSTINVGGQTLTLPSATDTVVGRATTDTLTNKTMSGVNNTFTNIPAATALSGAVPIANGGTGQTTKTEGYDALSPNTTKGDITVHNGTDNIRVAIGADETTLVADSTQPSGVKWAAAQAGLKNYILNSGAEANLNGWVTYADAAGEAPVDGTGGSPTITLTRSTSSPLRGTASFLMTKTAANSQGQGVSYDFTIDSADTAKILKVSMDYAITSGTYSGGTSTTDSDVECYLYDVTNAQVIQPAGYKLDGSVIGQKYQVNATFQTTSNSTSYRLILHIPTTSASAYTVQFDNVYVTPQFVSIGSMVGGWQEYTVAITGTSSNPSIGTTTFNKARWRRVGEDVEIDWYFKQTGAGSAGSGDYLFSLPPGLSMDVTAYGTGSNYLMQGYGQIGDQGAVAVPVPYDSTRFKVEIDDGTLNTYLSSSTWGLNGTDRRLNLVIKVKIAGWGTSQVLSSETDTRVVAAYVYGTPAAYSAGAPIIFPIISKDTHSAYNTSTGRYLVPVSGFYEVNAYTISNNAPYTVYVSRNGSGTSGPDAVTMYASPNSSDNRVGGSALIYANAGDFLDIRQDTSAGTVGLGHCSFMRVSGPSQIATSETVAFSARASSLTVTNGQYNTIPFTIGQVQLDTHSAYNTSTNIYTVPVPGIYEIGVGGQNNMSSNAEYIITAYTLNGGSEIFLGGGNGGTNFNATGFGADIIRLKAGDTIRFRVHPRSSTTVNSPYSTIKRVGN